MGSENAATGAVPGAGTGSENKAAAARRAAADPPALTYAAVLEEYANLLARADLTAQARRTYLSRVRMYLSWLADTHVDGDPLNGPAAAAWAARDYKSHLYGAQKRAPATVNAALAAVSDLRSAAVSAPSTPTWLPVWNCCKGGHPKHSPAATTPAGNAPPKLPHPATGHWPPSCATPEPESARPSA